MYAGHVPLDDPRISPVRADATGLGPTLVVYGDREIPRDDIARFVRQLEQARVEVSAFVARDLPHNALIFAELHPNAAAGFARTVAFIRE